MTRGKRIFPRCMSTSRHKCCVVQMHRFFALVLDLLRIVFGILFLVHFESFCFLLIIV
jgi:hypothetical protein